jgi:hypothetical protein
MVKNTPKKRKNIETTYNFNLNLVKIERVWQGIIIFKIDFATLIKTFYSASTSLNQGDLKVWWFLRRP